MIAHAVCAGVLAAVFVASELGDERTSYHLSVASLALSCPLSGCLWS